MSVELDQAFISYTSDLQEERKAASEVCSALKVHPFWYENEGANKEIPIDLILAELLRSEVFLGILGGRHGHPHPPPEGRSIVQFEYESFVKQREGHSRESYEIAIYPKMLPADKIEPKQLEFRNTFNFTRGPWAKHFDTTIQLREAIFITLGNWKGRRQVERNKKEEPDKARIHRNARLIATTIACSAVLVTTVWAIFTLGLSSNPIAIMLVCVAWSILLCWVVTRIY